MDRTIKTFKVDFDYDGVQLSGICRRVGEQMQVEMTAPMNGIVSFVCRWPFRPRMIENTVEDEAIEETEEKSEPEKKKKKGFFSRLFGRKDDGEDD